MKQIRLKLPNGKIETFQVTYQCKEYIFCECLTDPAARGFFTTAFVNNNQQP